jgi:pilus assembly protein Flp/PilA
MIKLKAIVKTFLGRREGATMVEYGLVLAFIALICFAAVQSVGQQAKILYPSGIAASL